MIGEKWRRHLRERLVEQQMAHIELVRREMRATRGTESWFIGWDRRMEKVLKELRAELDELRRARKRRR